MEFNRTSCYFSEPSFEHLNEFNGSTIWKEKKPKSCLKKTKRVSTNVVPDVDHHQQKNKVLKKFNVHQLSDMNQLIGNSKMLIGSLKDIFGITLPGTLTFLNFTRIKKIFLTKYMTHFYYRTWCA